MKSINPIRMNLVEKLRNPDYFYKFFMGRCQDEIASTIIDMRDKRGKNQKELAELSGMKQSAISRLEQSSYASWNFKTLWRIARALQGRWKLVLEPMEGVLREYELKEKELNSNLPDLEKGVLAKKRRDEEENIHLLKPIPGKGILRTLTGETRAHQESLTGSPLQ